MLASILPFSAEQADKVSEYCEKHSDTLPEELEKHWHWTIDHCVDADMMSSKLQGQWMIWMSQWIAPKRILEIGTFTGFSAMSWYEGTKATQAEIVTLDIRSDILDTARQIFKDFKVDDRVKVVEGAALKTLHQVEPEFELIFLDADKQNNEGYINTILERRLLSPNGIILVDNVFTRGLTIDKTCNPLEEKITLPFWQKGGEVMRVFNEKMAKDPRIDTLFLPVFDGVLQIKWNAEYLKASRA